MEHVPTAPHHPVGAPKPHLATELFERQRSHPSSTGLHVDARKSVDQMVRHLRPWARKRVLLEGA